MLQPPILQSDISDARRGPGRSRRYAERLIPRKIGIPPTLLKRLKEEAAWRAARAGDPDEWSFSRVAVEDLATLYGIDLYAPEENGNAR